MSGIKKPSIKKPINGIKKPAVKPKAPVIKEEVVEEKVVEIPVVVDQVEEIAPELEEILAQDEKHQEQEKQQVVEEVNEEPVQEPEPAQEPEPVVEEKPKAKKSRKSTKKKEEPKEEVIEENLPNMDLNSAIITMGKMCPTLPEWEEAKLEIEDKLRATAIDPDIDPASGRMLIGEIDALLCELRVYKVDQEAEVKAITEMVEYIRLSNAVGTNTEERKASGMKALMNHKVDPSSTETVNLVEYKLFYESKLAFFNEAIEILKDRKQLLITFQGMMKIESTF